MLLPRPDVVRKREMSREKHVFDKWAHLDEALRTEMARIGLWLDTANMTADETVDEILRRADEARID
jgi:hypothetical protein